MPTESAATAINSRLHRIENKLDDLTEAFVILARTEEKLTTAERDRMEIQNRINKIESKIEDINSKVESSLSTTSTINRLFWLVLSGGIATYAVQFFEYFK